jgi:hypothetical protein
MKEQVFRWLRDLGRGAVFPAVLDRLGELLREGDGTARCLAAELLGGMGPEAARSDLLEGLVPLLSARAYAVRWSALRALDRLHRSGVRVFRRPSRLERGLRLLPFGGPRLVGPPSGAFTTPSWLQRRASAWEVLPVAKLSS